MVLPYSRYLFVRPVVSMTQRAWTEAHVAAFEFFGWVPRKLTPGYVARNIIGHHHGEHTAEERPGILAPGDDLLHRHRERQVHEHVPGKAGGEHQRVQLAAPVLASRDQPQVAEIDLQLTARRSVINRPGHLLPAGPAPLGLTRGWIQPLLDSAAIRRDVTRFARAMRRTELAGAATWLGQFEGPVRLVWGTRDKHFTIGLGRRLAAAFRLAQFEEVADATTFVSIDRPDTVVSAVRDVLATPHT